MFHFQLLQKYCMLEPGECWCIYEQLGKPEKPRKPRNQL